MMDEVRTVTVQAGPYATVRAVEKARHRHGENVTVGGIVGPTTERTYIYEVIPLSEPQEGESE